MTYLWESNCDRPLWVITRRSVYLGRAAAFGGKAVAQRLPGERLLSARSGRSRSQRFFPLCDRMQVWNISAQT